MLAPLYQLGHIGDLGMIIVGLILGFLFGYLVENVGFANANNFTAAFYSEDWRIYKVLFTAILTAMILTFFCILSGFSGYFFSTIVSRLSGCPNRGWVDIRSRNCDWRVLSRDGYCSSHDP